MQDQYKPLKDALKNGAKGSEFFFADISQGIDVIYMDEMKPEEMEGICAALRKAASGNAVGQIIVVADPTLPVVLKKLKLERFKLQAAYAALPVEEWLCENGRNMANREQELYITLRVLESMLLREGSERQPQPANQTPAAEVQQPGYDEVVEAIKERDEAEEFGDKLLDLVLGDDRPEWSSAYGTDDALLQVEEKMEALSKQASAALTATQAQADARDASKEGAQSCN